MHTRTHTNTHTNTHTHTHPPTPQALATYIIHRQVQQLRETMHADVGVELCSHHGVVLNDAQL